VDMLVDIVPAGLDFSYFTFPQLDSCAWEGLS
jgi:hypothetical protein